MKAIQTLSGPTSNIDVDRGITRPAFTDQAAKTAVPALAITETLQKHVSTRCQLLIPDDGRQ